MNILAVDTTGEALSLALRAGEKTYGLSRKARAPHDETLIPAVEGLLGRAGLRLEDLDAIAAASGPGRFTGIRIGMAYAAVACSRLGMPALAVSRFEAAALGVPGSLVCAALPGFRDEKYYQLFRRRGGRLVPEGAPVWTGAQDWARAKAALEKRGAVVAEKDPGAMDLLEPASQILKGRRIPKFEPLYLKPAGYEAKAGGRRTKEAALAR